MSTWFSSFTGYIGSSVNTVRESVTTVTNWAVYQVQRPFRYIFTQDAEDVEVNNTQDANITQRTRWTKDY